MLPMHIPASSLSRLLKDFAALIESEWETGTNPLEWIAGCGERGCDAVIPWEYDPGDLELNPRKRLAQGEGLAIRLHTPYMDGPMTLIDGQEYIPAGLQADEEDTSSEDEEDVADDVESDDSDTQSEWLDFPSDPSFFALGIAREGNKLRIRPVAIYACSNPGGSSFRADSADFPLPFMNRIADYVKSLQSK